MFLVTTALEDFWNRNEKILFLGEWCKRYSRKSFWEGLNYEMLPYHWDDRQKLYKDYLYLADIYEKYLAILSERLNEIHRVSHSVRYWRIVVGLWLSYFIEILFDRYSSILTAMDSKKVTNTWVSLGESDEWMIPRDFSEFNTWILSDLYNHYLYSKVIMGTGGIPFEIKRMPLLPQQSLSNRNMPFLKKTLRRTLELYARCVPDVLNRRVFVSTYLSVLDLIKLQIEMRQLPYPFAPRIAGDRTNVNWSLRKHISFPPCSDRFELLLNQLLSEQIPLIYIEGYSDMCRKALSSFPKHPEMIFTANAYHVDEGFKFWASYHAERGVKLVVAQHGGNFGTALWISAEEHQIKISDRYYTWGWRSESSLQVVPLPAGKLVSERRKIQSKPDGIILWTTMSLPRYSYFLYSVPVSSQMLDYLEEQRRFVKAVSPEVHRLLLLRLYMHDYGWDEKDRWAEMDPDIKIYGGSKSFIQQLNESRLCISTYNSTTYLETFAANFPTILFWNPLHWELRDSAKLYFDELEKVGILHYTPESAAVKVNEIYRHPELWWQSTEVQRAKSMFCEQFARTSRDWLDEWTREFDQLVMK